MIILCNNTQPLGINGGYSGWSSPMECTQSCGGGVRLQERKCTNPKPSLNGRDCRGAHKRLAAAQWCNVHVSHHAHHINHKYLVEAKSSFRIFLSPIFRAVQERKNIATSNVRPVVTPLMLTISKAKVRLFCKAHLSLG
jgi:hypothetical protein